MSDTQKSGSKSLAAIAEEHLMTQLEDAVAGYNAAANFCCGGSIPIAAPNSTASRRYGDFTSTLSPITSPPVIIRWDDKNGDLGGKISFPVPEGKESVLEKLVKDCNPATFGYGGENVLDEKIRKAGVLEATEFSTNFNPYDYGMVDAVAKALLPGIARPNEEGKDGSEENWGVVAELYKLNVYSAPSDKFKPHVDTPRGFTQFGSLVVSLPNPHVGGHLRVDHKQITHIFDLGSCPSQETNSTDETPTLHWAAFYSDCSHEVLPVTSGHRLTLTYQLYISTHLSSQTLPLAPTLNPTSYPLYNTLHSLLSTPSFLKSGGTLGFHCSHKYAHTDGTANVRLPHALKGLDVVMYTIFKKLGMKVHVKPILEEEFSEGEDEEGNDLPNRYDEDYVKTSHTITRAAPEFRETRFIGEESGGDVEEYEIAKFWKPYEIFKHVKWLNNADAKANEVAMAFQQWCGNETETGWWYSFVAILVEVPPFSQRDLPPE
ncbi:hypothetical protein B0J14DRAFT_648860 [Halenospora varia]|nr:hypothetical protein B0J14DRAFT_648860 [Halenospora varia]